jgi:hypothetical protein
MGDWSQNISTQMKGCIPSLNQGLSKLLKKRFEVVEVQEYNTSRMYRGEVLENLTIKGKSIHHLLTLKRNPKSIIVDRDTNASKNILKIMKSYQEGKGRPEEFKNQRE